MQFSQLSSSVLLAFCLLLITAYGRTMQKQIVASPNTSTLLDSTNNYPSTTNYNDVNGLMKLINQYPRLMGEQFPLLSNDPCYPKLIWIQCTTYAPRRVTALYLGFYNLFGYLPDFSSMDALQTIELRQNYLYGPIPGFLGNFPMLTYLNLANNDFSGQIPYSLANNKRITLILSGNPKLCGSSYSSCSPPAAAAGTPFYNYMPPTSDSNIGIPDIPDMNKRKKNSKLPTILGVTIPPGLLITIVWGYCAIRNRRPNDVAVIAANAAAGGL